MVRIDQCQAILVCWDNARSLEKLSTLSDKPEHAVAYFAAASVTKAIKSFIRVLNLYERVLGLLFLLLLLVLVQQGGRLHHDAELNQGPML